MQYQTESEFKEMLEVYRALPNKRNVMEIGSMMGDTLRGWSSVGGPGLNMVSVDWMVPPDDHRHEACKKAHASWPAMVAEHGNKITVFNANSTLPETIANVRSVVPFLDFLFIDGGHDYNTVSADYHNYAPLVRPGGLIAFHDTSGSPPFHPEVRRLWEEVRGTTGFEINHPGGWGIAVLKAPRIRLAILTACSRPANLLKLKESVIPALEAFDLTWHIVGQHPGWEGNLPKDFLQPFIKLSTFTGESVAGKGQINSVMSSLTDNEWIYVLDDDNVLHPDFCYGVRKLMLEKPNAQGLLLSQLDPRVSGGVRHASPGLENIKVCLIDQAQFVLKKSLIGNELYANSYSGDGELIEKIYSRNSPLFAHSSAPLSYYNKLA